MKAQNVLKQLIRISKRYKGVLIEYNDRNYHSYITLKEFAVYYDGEDFQVKIHDAFGQNLTVSVSKIISISPWMKKKYKKVLI